MDRVDYQSFIIQDLLNDYLDEKINLNPWYQRRSVWTRAQKSYLLNTLFERKPIPAIYIRHSIDLQEGKSVKEIVDGQQRCRAIIEYHENAFSTRINESGDRKYFRQLTNNERERFLITPLPAGYLLGATDSDVIDIFGRINSVSKNLNAQEKRNARYSGEFKQFCLGFSTKNLLFWREAGIFTANDIARMNEVLFVSDLIFNLLNGLSDYRPVDIDRIYKQNEDIFDEEEAISRRLDVIFDAFFEIDSAAFKNTIFRRPPIFFSLVFCLDSRGGNIPRDIVEKIYAIDSEFRDEQVRGPEIDAFRDAVSASTQRLSSRQTRQDFLESRL